MCSKIGFAEMFSTEIFLDEAESLFWTILQFSKSSKKVSWSLNRRLREHRIRHKRQKLKKLAPNAER